jgi:cyclic beta-1,2-glucan synthetase
LRIAPCIPKDWPGFTIRYRYGRSTLQIDVRNPQGVTRGVREVRLDGRILPDGEIPLIDDGATHEAQIEMG